VPCSPVDPELLRLLLPGPAEASRRQKLLRLIEELCQAEAGYAPPAPVDAAGAEARQLLELERSERTRCLDLLARAYLGVGLEPDGYWSAVVSPGEAAEAWRGLLRQRTAGGEIPHPPSPGESPLQVAERLLEALRTLEGNAFAERLWELRLCLARGGSAALADQLDAGGARGGPQRESGRRRAGGGGPLERRGLLALEAELWLERGAPARVERLLEAHPLELALDERLQRALSLARLALERPLGGLAAVLSACRRPWPAAILEWSAAQPALARTLGFGEAELERGRAALQVVPRGALAAPGTAFADADRRAVVLERAPLGAAALLWFELVPGGDPRLRASDLAPALGERLARFRAGLPGALRDGRRAEAELLQSARPVRRYAPSGGELSGTLGPARALCLWPLFDGEGELCGWLHLEWEHQLLPAAARLVELARRVGSAVHLAGLGSDVRLRADETRVAEAPGTAIAALPEPATSAFSGDWPGLEMDDPRQRLAQDLAGSLGVKWGRRRWWCLELCEGRATLVSHGGEGLFDWRRWPGEGRAWRRAARTGLPLAFGARADDQSGLPLCSGSRSGIVVPWVQGAVQALWLIESERRGDFAGGDLERVAQLLAARADDYQRARLRSWARSMGDGDLAPELLWPGDLVELRALSAAQRWPAVRGPSGSGRSSLLAWMQFLRQEGGPPAWPRARFLPSLTAEDWRLLETPGEPWILAELSSATPAAQERLADCLARGARARGLSFELAPGEEPFAPLAQQLSAGALELAPIGPRRAGLVPAIQRLLERAAEAERRPTPQLSDAALGWLWRCDWTRGLRQLAELLRRLVLLAPPQPVDGSVVEALLRRAGLRSPRKLPSRHPEPELLLNALDATGLYNGRRNKTRAARLLGWDVDTLESRLADRGLS
jgi:hypothetical protein